MKGIEVEGVKTSDLDISLLLLKNGKKGSEWMGYICEFAYLFLLPQKSV